MTFTLAIESATRQATIALGRGQEVLYQATAEPGGNRDLAGLLRSGLIEISQTVNNIDLVAVNIGPGGLSSVRCGAAFANALAFSLNKPLLPFSSFELLGFEAAKKMNVPVLCISKAADAKAFVALYQDGVVSRQHFGPLEPTVKAVAGDLDQFAIAGALRQQAMALFPGKNVLDSGLQTAHAASFFEMAAPISNRKSQFTKQVHPINDQSELFIKINAEA